VCEDITSRLLGPPVGLPNQCFWPDLRSLPFNKHQWSGCRGWSTALGGSPSTTFQTGFHTLNALGQPVLALDISTISVTFGRL